MSSLLRRSINSSRLGDLLVQAGILTQAQLGEAVRNSRQKGIQLGQALVMNGVIAPRDLQSALDAQSMLRDKTVDFNEALRCLKIAYKVSSSFKDILNEYASPKKSQTSKLGELLIESGLVTYEVLARAVEQSNSTGLPLGRMLVLHQTLTNETLTFALDLQVRVRDEMISREEAIAALRKAAGLSPQSGPEAVAADAAQSPSSTTIDQGERAEAAAMQRLKDGPRKRGLRLGELMVMAGVLTETDVMNALEWGLVNHQPMGKVLLTQKLVSESILDAALAIQKMVDKDNLEPLKASELLARVHGSAISLDDAVAEMKAEEEGSEKEITYERLLTLARVLDEDELEDAFDIQSKSSAIIGKVLVLTGHMDVPTLQATLRCHQLLSRGHLTPDDAVVTLDYCLHHNPDGPMKLDDALKELGWSKDKGLRLLGEPQSTAAAPSETVSDAVPGQTAFAPVAEQIAAIPEADAGIDISGAGLTQENPAAQNHQIRHSETIQPEDARATRLAAILKGQKETDSALLANFDPSQQPPDALQSVFERLAHSYFVRGDYPQAQVIYERILVHRLNQIGPQDSALFTDLNNLAGVLIAQEHFAQAEPFMRRALKLLESTPTADPRRIADALSALATIYFRQEKAREAEPLLRRALSLRREHAVSEPELAQTLSDLAKVLRRLEQNEEAESMYQQSLAMLSQIETETGTGEFESV